MFIKSAIAILFSLYGCSTIILDRSEAFKCGANLTRLTAHRGTLEITRNLDSCGFETLDNNTFLAFRVDQLKLKPNDSVKISWESTKADGYELSRPFFQGYHALSLTEPKLDFFFKDLDDTMMYVDFIQFVRSIPINGDVAGSLQIQPHSLDSVDLNIEKTSGAPIHLEILGAHHETVDLRQNNLFVKDNFVLRNLTFHKGQPVVVRTVPVLETCSNVMDLKNDAKAIDITGPDTKNLTGPYRCLYIFTTSLSHFDVDFANFIDVNDVDDELIIDDGYNPLKIARPTASDLGKHIISFRGSTIVVIYNSPRSVAPENIQFKLTIRPRASGGVVDKTGQLNVESGYVSFVLKPQPSEYARISIANTKLVGSNMTLSDGSNSATLLDGSILPPLIESDIQGAPLHLEFTSTVKLTGFSFDPKPTSCSGILYEPTGTVSPREFSSADSCSWLFGKGARLKFDFHQLEPSGCLEIHTMDKQIFKRCGVPASEPLPTFDLEQGFMMITSPTNLTSLSASASKPLASINVVTTSTGINYFSYGYPNSYIWQVKQETFDIPSRTGKTLLFSVQDLALRAGEMMTLNGNALKSDEFFTTTDIELPKGKASNIQIDRSNAKEDYNITRGYKLVVTEFEFIMQANISKSSVTTPKNLSSLLLKISAPKNERILYNVTFASAKSSYTVTLLDSPTILGRSVYDDEKSHGSTTSNTLLISLRATKTDVTLPEMVVAYSSQKCNETIDHLCDNKTRCVPASKLCKGLSYCADGSDLRVVCSSGPAPPPKIIETGVSGISAFVISVIMFTLGALAAIYGPDLYKNFDGRFRAGRYTSFTSTE